jgi:hypothetical protein
VDCRDALVGDIVVSPCCPGGTQDQCGLDLSRVAEFMPLRAECVGIDQPGNLDSSCPDVLFDDPTERRELPGCCTASGRGGGMADLSLLADFGCLLADELLLASSEEPTSCSPDRPEPEPEPEPEPTQEPEPDADEDGGAPPDPDRMDASVPEPSDAGEGDVDAADPEPEPAPSSEDAGNPDGGN